MKISKKKKRFEKQTTTTSLIYIFSSTQKLKKVSTSGMAPKSNSFLCVQGWAGNHNVLLSFFFSNCSTFASSPVLPSITTTTTTFYQWCDICKITTTPRPPQPVWYLTRTVTSLFFSWTLYIIHCFPPRVPLTQNSFCSSCCHCLFWLKLTIVTRFRDKSHSKNKQVQLLPPIPTGTAKSTARSVRQSKSIGETII